MTDHPSLTEQIDAVEWAEANAREWSEWSKVSLSKYTELQISNIEELCRRLEAAAETLRTLEFGSAVAR